MSTMKKVPMSFARSSRLAAVLVPLALVIAACGSDGNDDSSDATDQTTTTAVAASPSAPPEGPACIPDLGDVTDEPVTEALAAVPSLSTLGDAIAAADLGETLEGANSMTVFAPTNNAFGAIPPDQLNAILADQEQLTAILTYHVVPQAISPDDLGGTYATVNGADLTVTGEAPAFEVGTGGARVVCSGVETANATVYLVDSVLLPPS